MLSSIHNNFYTSQMIGCSIMHQHSHATALRLTLAVILLHKSYIRIIWKN